MLDLTSELTFKFEGPNEVNIVLIGFGLNQTLTICRYVAPCPNDFICIFSCSTSRLCVYTSVTFLLVVNLFILQKLSVFDVFKKNVAWTIKLFENK